MANLPTISLLTYSGTLACIDTTFGEVVHRPVDEIAPPIFPLGVERRGEGFGVTISCQSPPAILARLALKMGARQPLLTLWAGDKLLRFDLNGSTYHGSQDLGDFEQLVPVPARDMALLHGAMSKLWMIGESPPVPAGLARFNLVLGTRTFGLGTMLPLDASSTPDLLAFNSGGEKITARRAARPPAQPAIWIHPLGNIGNRALQYLVAHGIARRVPGAVVRNIHLDMWNMQTPAARPPRWDSAGTGWRYRIDTEGLADCLRRGEVGNVIVDSYPYHLSHFPPRNECRALLPPLKLETTAFAPNELVCSVRANEILHSAHPDYLPLPPGYYRMLQEATGLDLVFFGQLGKDAYSNALRAAFPKARFVPGRNQAHDFESLRRARNIALSISTFAWLAAWLGEAERIFLPVGGIFSPVQHPDFLLIPLQDPAYRYTLLPPAEAVNLFKSPTQFWRMQDYIARHARLAGKEEIAALCARADSIGHGKIWVRGFDRHWYAAKYGDTAIRVRGLEETALGHHLFLGPGDVRPYRQFDPVFYGNTYPDALEAVTFGHYRTLFQHFILKGEALGYRPVPPHKPPSPASGTPPPSDAPPR